VIKLIFNPKNYLNIKLTQNSEQKHYLDVVIPFSISIVLSLILLIINSIDNTINIFYKDIGLLGSITNFFQSMPGFYIAALAAIATFPSESMNRPMRDPAPYLLKDVSEKDIDSNRDILSRRRFLCYMFAYLAFISIVFFFMSVLLSFLYSFNIFIIDSFWLDFGYFLSCFLVFYITSQAIIITFLGLWYLGSRIHFNDNS
jgi:uncharacterized membrane protein